MTRDQLADELLEIRRYVRTDDDVRRRVLVLIQQIQDLRLIQNLACGLRHIQVDPEVLEGYLYAAAFELRCGKEK